MIMNRLTCRQLWIGLWAVLLTGLALAAGCASEGSKEQGFFTSGSHEADQRAEQRIAKSQQIKGKSADQEEDRKDGKAKEKQTLYQRLGDEDGINRIVEDFVPRALADPRINWERKGVSQRTFLGLGSGKSVEWQASGDNVARLKRHLAQFIALATGGPAKYDGGEIAQVHKGLKITNTEFDASVGDLKASLDKLAVPIDDQKELLAIIESTRTQVVEER